MIRWDEETGAVGISRHPRATRTGERATARAGSSPASTDGAGDAHRARRTITHDRRSDRRQAFSSSPNDVVVRSEGSISFTDPSYGIDSFYEGHRAESEIGRATSTGSIRRAARSGSSRTTSPGRTASPSRWTRRRSTSPTPRSPEHPRLHRDRGGRSRGRPHLRRVHCRGVRRNPARHAGPDLGRGRRRRPLLRPGRDADRQAPPPEPASNLVFGGLKRNRLFVTASTSLYSLMLNANGAPTPWQG